MLMIERRQIDVLPPVARSFVRDLEAAYHDAAHLAAAANERLKNLVRLQNPYVVKAASGAKMTPDEEERLKSLNSDAELARLHHQKASAASSAASQIFSGVVSWVTQAALDPDSLRVKGLEVVDIPLPKPSGTIDDVRRQIAENQATRLEIERAQLDRASLERAIRMQVATLATKSKPQMLGTDGRGKFEILLRDAKPLALLAWFDPDGLIKRLMQDLPPAPAGALSADQKRAKIAEIDETRLRLERMEEALVRATGAARRANADMAAVLSVEIRPVKAAKPAKAA